MMNPTSTQKKLALEVRLQRAALQAAGSAPFSPESIKRLFEMIQKGVETIDGDDSLDDVATLLRAEFAITMFVAQMLKERGSSDRLEESTFSKVYNFFCPGFLPFC